MERLIPKLLTKLIKSKHAKDINFAVTKSYENTSVFWRELRPMFILEFAARDAFEGFDLRCN